MATVEGSTTLTSAGVTKNDLDTSFAPLRIVKYPKKALAPGKEEKFWRSFTKRTEIPNAFKGRISSIDFNRRSPFTVAVTSQTKVGLYNPTTHDTVKEWHPKETIYCTRWRQDGKMLVSSGEHPTVKVWTIGNMKMIRELRADLEGEQGHKRAVHTVHFLCDKRHVLSGSDDHTAIIWDMPTQQQELKLTGHTDYVRACAPHPFDKNIVATASHDHTIRVWDTRVGTTPIHSFQADDAVSSLAFHPSGGLLATAASSTASVWDIAMVSDSTEAKAKSESALCHLSNHTKDITCLCYNESGSRLLTASVDRHVKVYETEMHTAVHTLSYPEPIFAIGLSPDGKCMAVGSLEGKLYLRTREKGESKTGFVEEEEENPTMELYSGLGDMTVERRRNWNKPVHSKVAESDHFVEAEHKGRVRPYDEALRKFNYHMVLDLALKESKKNYDRYNIFHSVLVELQRRNGLRVALAGRTADDISEILKYVHKGITDPRYSIMLCNVLNILIEIYHAVFHESRSVSAQLRAVHKKVATQVGLLTELQVVSGTIDGLISRSKLVAKKRARVVEEDVEDVEEAEDMDEEIH